MCTWQCLPYFRSNSVSPSVYQYSDHYFDYVAHFFKTQIVVIIKSSSCVSYLCYQHMLIISFQVNALNCVIWTSLLYCKCSCTNFLVDLSEVRLSSLHNAPKLFCVFSYFFFFFQFVLFSIFIVISICFSFPVRASLTVLFFFLLLFFFLVFPCLLLFIMLLFLFRDINTVIILRRADRHRGRSDRKSGTLKDRQTERLRA